MYILNLKGRYYIFRWTNAHVLRRPFIYFFFRQCHEAIAYSILIFVLDQIYGTILIGRIQHQITSKTIGNRKHFNNNNKKKIVDDGMTELMFSIPLN